MSRPARNVGHMDLATTDFTGARPAGTRRCRRCGAFLSASNVDNNCFPCQRTEREALWPGTPVRRGRAFPDGQAARR